MIQIVAICVVVLYVLWEFFDNQRVISKRGSKTSSYQLSILFNVIMLGLVIGLGYEIDFSGNFDQLGRGVEFLNAAMIYGLLAILTIIILVVPFVQTKMNKRLKTSDDIAYLLPNNNKEYVWFMILIIVLAINQEIIFREFMFDHISNQYGLYGDQLLVVSSVVYGMIFLYFGFNSILSNILLGLVLGKLFQISESIIPGIVLNFLINFRILWNQYISNRKFGQ